MNTQDELVEKMAKSIRQHENIRTTYNIEETYRVMARAALAVAQQELKVKVPTKREPGFVLNEREEGYELGRNDTIDEVLRLNGATP